MARHFKPNISGFSNPKPEQLKMARLARGLSVTDLSGLIGVTKQAISQYENGKSVPSADTLSKLIQVLKFPASFFMAPIKSSKHEPVTFFRSLKSATQKARGMQSVRSDFLEWTYNYLSNYLEFPSLNLPKISEDILQNPSEDDIEDIASLVRRHWGIGEGPISNVILLMERNGIVMGNSQSIDEKLDAFSEMRDRPFIILGDNKKSAARARFNAAHELGHMILHTWIPKEELDEVLLKKIEREANLFAGAFLLPRSTFGNEVMSSSLEHFIDLKRRWKVSIQAMIYRCSELGILTDNQVLYLRKQMSARKMNKKEPLDDYLEREQPTIIKRSIKMLVEHRVLTPEEIVDNLCLPSDEIQELFNIEKGFFNEVDNIVPLRLIKTNDTNAN